MSDIDQKASDILALLRGAPGPFLETQTSFFGRKNTDPSMKDAGMQTDIGGMLITKTPMTYGEADTLATSVDLTDYPAFIRELKQNAYWKDKYGENGWCHKNTDPDWHFYGEIFWSIYNFLATKGYLEGDPKSYKNSCEYLYLQVLKRLVKAEVFQTDTTGRYFTLSRTPA